ncbi:histone H1 [Chryseobacterium camelliae]|uniref:Histone H1 n=1 Tax=Chryseobacterium camelliae TaxID=1265445 RepID=A0ABY7QR19_9FLAO|nr:histone H1 [Chryseobacterium camelliae]WBV61253.1 histone H1 [Chryseobacterium camelliae]
MKEIIRKINEEFEIFITDSTLQFQKGNKAAGSRARKSATKLGKLFKEFRKTSVEEAKK